MTCSSAFWRSQTAPIWAGALIPACVHGWPPGIDPSAFAGLARSIGAFGGWVDDVVDVVEDLHAGALEPRDSRDLPMCEPPFGRWSDW